MKIQNIFISWIVILVVSSIPIGLGVSDATARNSSIGEIALYKNVQNESNQVREQMKNFLVAWLTEQNTRDALGFFSKNAFANQAMLSEDCAGYISPQQRQSPSAIKSGVEEFLNGWIEGPKGRPLSQVLNKSRISGIGNKSIEIVNNIERDGYALYKIDRTRPAELMDDKAGAEYLHSYLPNGQLYISLIAIEDDVFYLIWAKEKERWRIFHVSIVCP